MDLHIDAVVLHGIPFTRQQREDFAEALRVELTRLLGEESGPPEPVERRVRHVDAGALAVPAGTTPQRFGTQVAAAIHRGLGGAR